ncbi:MAG: Flp pilus assembly protein CpaB [Idiomarina sp.]|nr:Flp pilus assembly protein CpaB [Idiomarina sp.]
MINRDGLRSLLVPLCLGLLCAVLAIYLLVRHVQSIEQQTYLATQLSEPKPVAKRPVVVASILLTAGDVLHEEHLRVREFDATMVPVDSIHPADISQFLGVRLRADIGAAIPAGVPIQKLHLQPTPAEHRLPLAAGMVPFSLAVNSLQSHAGMLQVGDIVDLYHHQQDKATLINERIQVLAIGSQRERVAPSRDTVSQHGSAYSASQYQQITLAVPLKKLALLKQLAHQQQLLPVLRDANDQVRIVTLPSLSKVEVINAGQQPRMDGLANLSPPIWPVDEQQPLHWGAANHEY